MRSAICHQLRLGLDTKRTSDSIPTETLDAPVALGQQIHVCLNKRRTRRLCDAPPHINAACRNYKLLDVTAVTCDRISSGALPACNGTRTTINGRIDTVALASLVRVASSYRPRPSRTTASSVAPVFWIGNGVWASPAVWDHAGFIGRFGMARDISPGNFRSFATFAAIRRAL
jgi:hypothetical protein